MRNKTNTLKLVQFAILLAVEAACCFIPILGSVPIGPMVATTAMIPVIITAILLGTKAGAAMGFVAGLFSFIVWTFMPPSPIAFIFTPFHSLGGVQGNFGSLLICFFPRIMIGVTAGYTHSLMTKCFPKHDWLSYGLAGFLGSMANTVFVMLGVFVFFAEEYAQAAGTTIVIALSAMLTVNGIAEAIVSTLAAYFVCKPLKRILSNVKTP